MSMLIITYVVFVEILMFVGCSNAYTELEILCLGLFKYPKGHTECSDARRAISRTARRIKYIR